MVLSDLGQDHTGSPGIPVLGSLYGEIFGAKDAVVETTPSSSPIFPKRKMGERKPHSAQKIRTVLALSPIFSF
jgi:hypothetical protein